MYARSGDRARLTTRALDSAGDLRIGAGSTPGRVASAAIGAWLATNRKPGTDDAGIWHDTVPAALYTRQSPALVRKLWARTESALARRQSAAGSAEERAA
jgi:hypothetical protein